MCSANCPLEPEKDQDVTPSFCFANANISEHDGILVLSVSHAWHSKLTGQRKDSPIEVIQVDHSSTPITARDYVPRINSRHKLLVAAFSILP